MLLQLIFFYLFFNTDFFFKKFYVFRNIRLSETENFYVIRFIRTLFLQSFKFWGIFGLPNLP